MEMDADFSHNPKDVPRLLDSASQYDVVVGSRYIEKGGVSNRWNVLRKLISRFGNFYARFITGLEIRDCTGGFRCYKKKALKSIDFSKNFLNGYGFQVQMAYELRKNNFSMHEIPIFFEERAKGSSKMSLQIIIEAFFTLAREIMGEALTTHFSGIGHPLSELIGGYLKRRYIKAVKRIQELLTAQAGYFRGF